ncbi:zinc finger MYM-type protein 1-like [Mercenaria mercenaria]|uniref:zinc finger MYM-type protein 1-like n=1 Tax=Mercenaria mercenaria TaxID=6596 RepID=UPI00234F4CA9|nr:zinc finger MYM-type protein 1-like [Mercenaria mercenaria]
MATACPPYPDPGETKLWNNDNKLSLLSNKWKDSKEYKFPPRNIGGKERRFNSNWLADYHLLRYSQSQDSVYCAPCLLFGSSKDRALSSSAVSDWKNLSTYVKRHQVDELHRASVVLAENFVDVMVGKKESILCKISSSSKQIVEKKWHVLKEIIEVLIMLGKQNIAIRGHKEEKSNFMAVLQGLAKKDPVLSDHLANAPSNAKYTSPEIQNELLSLCGDQILDMLTTQCKNAGVFAIMADESSDISTKEQLSICVRYIEKNEHNRHKLREDFLGFITCKSIKGQAIAQLTLENLQHWGLDVLKLRAQCYDGASNMSGKDNGVQALI